MAFCGAILCSPIVTSDCCLVTLLIQKFSTCVFMYFWLSWNYRWQHGVSFYNLKMDLLILNEVIQTLSLRRHLFLFTLFWYSDIIPLLMIPHKFLLILFCFSLSFFWMFQKKRLVLLSYKWDHHRLSSLDLTGSHVLKIWYFELPLIFVILVFYKKNLSHVWQKCAKFCCLLCYNFCVLMRARFACIICSNFAEVILPDECKWCNVPTPPPLDLYTHDNTSNIS